MSAPAHPKRRCHELGGTSAPAAPGLMPQAAQTAARGTARQRLCSWQNIHGESPGTNSVPATHGTSSARSRHFCRPCHVTTSSAAGATLRACGAMLLRRAAQPGSTVGAFGSERRDRARSAQEDSYSNRYYSIVAHFTPAARSASKEREQRGRAAHLAVAADARPFVWPAASAARFARRVASRSHAR